MRADPGPRSEWRPRRGGPRSTLRNGDPDAVDPRSALGMSPDVAEPEARRPAASPHRHRGTRASASGRFTAVIHRVLTRLTEIH
jgi:hypothetical protein